MERVEIIGKVDRFYLNCFHRGGVLKATQCVRLTSQDFAYLGACRKELLGIPVGATVKVSFEVGQKPFKENVYSFRRLKFLGVV